MTRDEQGGELMFHYVRRQIRRRTTGSPLLSESITLHMRSGWNDNAYWQIHSCLFPSLSLSLQLPHAPAHVHSGIILHEQIIVFSNLLATSSGITLRVGPRFDVAAQERLPNWILAIFYSILLPLRVLLCQYSPANIAWWAEGTAVLIRSLSLRGELSQFRSPVMSLEPEASF